MRTSAITAAILIIGNEILSGRTQDTNVCYIAKNLSKLGIELLEVRVVPDDEGKIIEAVNTLRQTYTYVFTTGGIGATHDDITAASIAKAFGVNLVINPKAMAILKDYYQDDLNETRQRMALLPGGCDLIENPVSKAPAFRVGNVFCLAGMPSVMRGMFDFVMTQLETADPFYQTIITCELTEGIIGKKLGEIQQQYLEVNIGSYPFYQLSHVGVSLVIRGQNKPLIGQATAAVLKMIESFGGTAKVEEEIP